MMQRIRMAVATVPTPLAGLALGLGSLGWCWEYAADFSGRVQQAGAGIAGCLLLVLLLKFLLQPRLLRQDLAHPVMGSVLPTFAMGWMVVSVSLPVSVAVPLWLAALLLHLGFLLGFVWHRLQDLQLPLMIPGWFVPPVGIITAVVTCPQPAFSTLVQGIFWFGLICYSLLLPLMLFRLLFAGAVPDGAKPTIAVLAAPASLALAGYLSIAEPSGLLVAILLGIALLMTALIYLSLILLLNLPFTPGFAAYTFPLVISATALFKVSLLLSGNGAVAEAGWLHGLAIFELLVATAVTFYVCIRYAGYFWELYSERVLIPIS
ncbi:hypothetical protein QE250_09790 [Chromatiaceae bacterium AAb-1]|nr:hypothetical protein [Chromatiaceae bacterium AAb-1]